MPNLRYLFTSDADQQVASPLPFGLEEDSDGWWAGVQRCFVAVPIAGTLAAVALSASLAWGYQQQTEDVFPPPPQIAEEDLWQVWTPPSLAPRPLYLPDAEELPAGVLFGQPDEDYWQVSTPPYPPSRFVYLPDPEELPAGSLFGVPEEDPWQPLAAKPTLTTTWVWAIDEDIVPQPAPFAAEEYWAVSTPPYLVPRPLYLPDPEELPAGSLVAARIPILIVLSNEAAASPDVTGETVTTSGLSNEAAASPDVTGETFKPSG